MLFKVILNEDKWKVEMVEVDRKLSKGSSNESGGKSAIEWDGMAIS